jgi:regulator of sirC expression with transglutaminase-like and TPR domain
MKTESAATTHLETLRGLLDDPSPAVRSALLREFRELGDAAITYLRQLANGSDRAVSPHALEILRELNVTDTVGEFLSFIRSQRYELESGALLLARTVHPDLDAVRFCRELDRLAARCRELVVEPMAVREKCRVVNRVLFHELGLVGDVDHYTDPRNSFIHLVLERRRGIPITLSMLYLLVAERLGLNLEPVGLPGHFVVGCYVEERPFFVDPFYQGAFRTVDEVFQMLRQNNVIPRASDLAPTAVREVLLRCCRNLVNHYGTAGDTLHARLFASFVEEFESVHRQGAHSQSS